MVMRIKSTPAVVDEPPVHSTQLICTPKFVALMSAGVHVVPQRVELPPYVSMAPAVNHPLPAGKPPQGRRSETFVSCRRFPKQGFAAAEINFHWLPR